MTLDSMAIVILLIDAIFLGAATILSWREFQRRLPQVSRLERALPVVAFAGLFAIVAYSVTQM